MSSGSRLTNQSREVFIEVLRDSLRKPLVLEPLQQDFSLCAGALAGQGFTVGTVTATLDSDLEELSWVTLTAPVSSAGIREAADLELKVEVLVLARLQDDGSARGLRAQFRAQRIWQVLRKGDPDQRALSSYDFATKLDVEYVGQPEDLASLVAGTVADQYQSMDDATRIERSQKLARYLNEVMTP